VSHDDDTARMKGMSLDRRIDAPLRDALPALAAGFRAAGMWRTDTFMSVVLGHAGSAPERVAFRDDRSALTWAQLARAAYDAGRRLTSFGLGRGHVVGLRYANVLESVVAQLACELIGAQWINLSPTQSDADLGRVLSLAGANIVVGAPAGCRDVTDQRAGGPLRIEILEPARRDRLVALQPSIAAPMAADEVFTLVLSSGTTSAGPKLAMRTMASFLSTARAINAALALTETDRTFVLAPICFGAGHSLGVVSVLQAGGAGDFTNQAPGPALLERLADADATVLVAVPTQLRRLIGAMGNGRCLLPSLRLVVTAGATLTPELAGEIEQRLNAPVLSVYGASDGVMSTLPLINDPFAMRSATVGRVSAGHDLKLIDVTGGAVGPGDIGEVCARGPSMTLGYVNAPAEMRRAWDAEGWFHTGDLGTIDERGYLTLVGRLTDTIVRGGLKLNPVEIEAVLATSPAIEEVVVVRVPDLELGERACAVVVVKRDCSFTFTEMIALLERSGVSRSKFPESLVLRASLPRSGAHKVLRRELELELAQEPHVPACHAARAAGGP
jgi:acyl-CoA synthetase (AMP-forming)/AMP-acid ligase II